MDVILNTVVLIERGDIKMIQKAECKLFKEDKSVMWIKDSFRECQGV